MMTQAFYTGLSGIRSNQTAIDVTSDNIANISTTGFRGNSVEFSTIFDEAVVTADSMSSRNSIGIGSRVSTTSMLTESGSLQKTDRNTDLAINGDGWFGVVKGKDVLYTRAGDFVFDSNSDLMTIDGMYVMGTMSDNIDGNRLNQTVDETLLGDIANQETLRFPKDLVYPPVPTLNSAFYGNLGIDDSVKTFGTTAIDPQNNKNNLKLSFSKAETQVPPGIQWNVVATTQSLDGGTIYDTQEGIAYFDAEGSMLSNTLTTIDNNGTAVNIDLGSGYNGVVATNTPFSTGSSSSDGTIGGNLIGYEINKNAEVIATFTNGMQSSVGKIALYHFQNDQGLNRVSGTRYQETSNSGDALFFKDEKGENILGANISNFTLENSNVLMANSLTELIILQRSYDANSKTVTAADEMMQKALGMDA